jgi:hypothetical protein
MDENRQEIIIEACHFKISEPKINACLLTHLKNRILTLYHIGINIPNTYGDSTRNGM